MVLPVKLLIIGMVYSLQTKQHQQIVRIYQIWSVLVSKLSKFQYGLSSHLPVQIDDSNKMCVFSCVGFSYYLDSQLLTPPNTYLYTLVVEVSTNVFGFREN